MNALLDPQRPAITADPPGRSARETQDPPARPAVVVIPAYEPDARMVDVVADLRTAGSLVVVVDDGSGSGWTAVFQAAAAAGADVITHERNRGKGAALKTAYAYLAQVHPGSDVVTADADGQHTVADILRVTEALAADRRQGTPTLILGCRAFAGDVPLRSRVGNTVARMLFRAAAGWALSDTQTGLRGLPAVMLPWLADQPGDRFDYEQQVLLRARRDGWATREVPIETVYLDANASSHFRPVVDSVLIILPLLLFAGSSFLSFLIDTAALLVLQATTGSLVGSIIGARLISGTVNFALNRRYVFRGDVVPAPGAARSHKPLPRCARRIVGEAFRYGALAAVLLASNLAWMTSLTAIGVPLLVAKVLTEAALFVLGYRAQRAFVFSATRSTEGADAHP